MKDNDMYGLLALTDMAITIVLQLCADMGKDPEVMTREDWLIVNASNIERRKGIMAKIRAH